MTRRLPVLVELAAVLLRVLEIGTIGLIGTLLDIARNEVSLAMILYAGLAQLTGAYDADIRFSVRKSWKRMLSAGGAAALFMTTLHLLLESAQVPQMMSSLLWFFGSATTMCMLRAGLTLELRRHQRAGRFNQRVAIYGANRQGQELARYLQGNAKLTISIAGFYDERSPARLGEDAPPLKGNLNMLIADIRQNQIDQVIIALPWSDDIYMRGVVSRLTLTPVRIRLAPDLALLAYPDRPLVMLGDVPLMTLFERPISGLDQVVKRLEDVLLAALFIVMLSPVLLLTALAIKLDSSGPIFFRQPREGFNNQSFRIWKFRSMHAARGQTNAIQQATRRDPRITHVGAFIRRTSIDELPQLFNVLIGDMSLVGPRPHAPSTCAGNTPFPDVIHTYAARHKVKPGITGWAQVCGWRGETDTEDKLVQRVEHDLYYIEHWSVLFDFYILLRTAFALTGKGVY